jgi:hypothetical protein
MRIMKKICGLLLIILFMILMLLPGFSVPVRAVNETIYPVVTLHVLAGDYLTIQFNTSEKRAYVLYVKGFVLPNEWINNEENTLEIIREDGLKIEISIPAVEPNQTTVTIYKLVIKYEE